MSLLNSNYENDPVIVNLSQNLRYHKNHHAGILNTVDGPFGEENPRVKVRWSPKDSVDSQEAKRECRTSVRKDRIVEWAPGVIAPRGVIWLMPDKADQLPQQVRTHPQLNPFFNGWYRHQNVIEALKYKARTETEVMDKLRFATTPSELDDRVARAFNNYLDQVEDHAEAMNSSSGNGDS